MLGVQCSDAPTMWRHSDLKGQPDAVVFAGGQGLPLRMEPPGPDVPPGPGGSVCHVAQALDVQNVNPAASQVHHAGFLS